MNPQSMLKTGAVKSTSDYRDAIFASLVAIQSLPPTQIQTDFSKFGIYDQLLTPSCVSHSVAKLMQLYWYLKTGEVITFNPQFLHIASAFVGAGPDDGRDPRTVLQCAKTIGCATIATMPINTNVSNEQYCDPTQITEAMREEALKYAIPGFVAVSVTPGAFRSAIDQYGAISTLFEVGDTFWTAPDGSITWAKESIDPIRATSQLSSAHELTIIGQENADLFRGVNSWGDTWDDAGYFNFVLNEWQPYIAEAWAIVNPNPEALALIQSLPEAGEFSHNFEVTLQSGMNSDEVRALQIALAIDGDFDYPEITGFYGSLTAQAVTKFQTKYALASPAIIASLQGSQVGPATRAKLNSLFNK